MERRAAATLVVVAAMLWGTTGTARALGGGTPLAVGALRLAIAAVALALLGGRIALRRPFGALAVAALAMASYQVTFFAGVARAGVAVGTLVAIGCAPVIAGLLAWLIRSERPERRWWTATIMAVGGLAVIVGRPGDVDVPGVLLATLAGLGYAIYALASKHLLETMAPRDAMTAVFVAAALLLAPLLWTSDLAWLLAPVGVVSALWLGVAATALAYLAFARGLSALPVGTATTLTLAEPATAALLGVAFLGERPSAPAWYGLAAISLGVVVLATGRRVTP